MQYCLHTNSAFNLMVSIKRSFFFRVITGQFTRVPSLVHSHFGAQVTENVTRFLSLRMLKYFSLKKA